MAKARAEIEWHKHLVDMLRKALGERVAVELLDGYPELVNRLAEGMAAPQVAEVLTAKLVRLALDPAKANRWVVEMIYAYVAGKPAQTTDDSDQGRHIEGRLDDITTEHLNALAQQFKAKGGGLEPVKVADETDRSLANPLLDLPSNRA